MTWCRHQKISCLCLLDLSAAFDTIDHNILITCLSSWFDLHGSVLEWFKSYLSERCFRVNCENSFSFSHAWFCGIPKSSVLDPLLCVIYTTPLSTLISSFSLNLPLESASQRTSPPYWSWRLITLIWSHTRQFIISFTTTVTIYYSSLPL